jgi:hypothetical protein
MPMDPGFLSLFIPSDCQNCSPNFGGSFSNLTDLATSRVSDSFKFGDSTFFLQLCDPVDLSRLLSDARSLYTRNVSVMH